ncbi:MAG: 3D domain-containing protein [Thermoleophilia bacterium]
MRRRHWILATLAAAAALVLAAQGHAAATGGKPRWLTGVVITEYYPVPEAWFSGALVEADGLQTLHRVDWLYSARGLPMEGSGVGLDGRFYHISATGGYGWVDERGRGTYVGSSSRPFWLNVGWRTRKGAVTFPLLDGRWARGKAKRFIEPRGVTFGEGMPKTLGYWVSAAVDPGVIPLGSTLFVPAYCGTPGKGWMVAADTGGAIDGLHIDVFRPAPRKAFGPVAYRSGQRVYVIPPGVDLPRKLPTCPATG